MGDVYGQVGLDAVDWLLASAIETEHGLSWPRARGGGPHDGLYAGTPGVMIALLAAHHATADARYIDAATAGGRHLIAVAPSSVSGLYTGVAGMGFALKALGDQAGVERCVDLISARAEPDGLWDGYADIIVGTAGVGLFLLAAGAIEEAAEAGRALIGQGIPAGPGMKWAMGRDPDRHLMPNFSHGTAGIAYFLATLAEATSEDAPLETACAGARYLLSVARTGDGTCAVFHFEPGGEDLYPLGWCHGPTGLASFFHRLASVTGDAAWLEWRDRCASTVRNSGIPERKHPGFWDNSAKCCGSTGVAELFLDLHRVTGDPEHLAFARVMADDILARATVDADGTRWSNVEHRADPPELPAFTGAMQGAAGIATFLLRLDGHLRGDDWHVAWPDSPFG